MKFLQDIGWYGLRRLQVWEIDEAGNLLSILLVRQKQNKLLLEAYDANPTLPIPNGAFPILLALQLEQKLEAKITMETSNPLAEVLGVSTVDEKQFVWQKVTLDDKEQWISLIRKDQLTPIWQVLAAYQGQLVSLNFSEQTNLLLGSDMREQEILAESLQIPHSALFPYAVALHYCQTHGRDLHGMDDLLAPTKRFSQTTSKI
ncbi:MAG: hypothetical protein AAFP02_03860, partial [Bacteroidota bacterium]